LILTRFVTASRNRECEAPQYGSPVGKSEIEENEEKLRMCVAEVKGAKKGQHAAGKKEEAIWILAQNLSILS